MENPIIFAGENPDDMKYPIGIQTFTKLREDDSAYVDKTALVYKLAREGSCYFLSRPRRFGKSLLLSTLKSYFQGNKEVFEGLAISKLEKEWKKYPVLHVDLNTALYNAPEALTGLLDYHLRSWEKSYHIVKTVDDISNRFRNVIVNAAQQSPEGKVVILVDEYDKPLLEAIGKPELQEEYRQILKAFYSNIKSCDEYIRFAMLTGVTKFSHLSIFSGLNNLRDISMLPQYADLCGFTQQELETTFSKSIDEFAASMNVNREEMLELLRKHYDGYHFSRDLSIGVYNPFSIINAFASNFLDAYWFATGTPTFLYKQMKEHNTNLLDLERLEVPASQFDASIETMNSVLPLLYQSGYLTIKGYDPDARLYTLSFPNTEVKVGFMENFLTNMTGTSDNSEGFASRFYVSLLRHDIDGAMRLMQSFFASVPYLDHGNNDLDELTRFEAYYEVLMYVVFSIFNCRVFTQVKTALGRADVVVFMKDATYVMELKIGGTAQEALEQIASKDYAIPYQGTGKPVIKIGIAFSKETRSVSDWIIEG
jgi:hypothetical protein